MSKRMRDKTVADSFPASDSAAQSRITGTKWPDKPSHKRNINEKPTETATSDRHGTEKVHGTSLGGRA
jgi:hypothetical protein